MKKRMNKIIVSGLMLTMLSFPLCVKADEISYESIEVANVKGIQSVSVDAINPVESAAALNLNAEEVSMRVEGNTIQVGMHVNGDNVAFALMMYPSKLGVDSQNRMIGVENESSSSRYSIIRFVIEKEASHMYLFKPNSAWLGKTVVNLGIADNENGKVYVVQFNTDQFDFETMYNSISPGGYSDRELLDKEISYFSLQTPSEIENSFKKINEITVKGSGFGSGENVEKFEDTEGTFLDELVDSGEFVNVNSRNLVADIPDYLYETQENGEWTIDKHDWSNGTQVGYMVFHMNDPMTQNVLNYAARYYATAAYNWPSERFDISFNLTHNLWVQYIHATGNIGFFDDRPSNGRIVIDADIYLKANEGGSTGYFTQVTHNAYKEGNILGKVARFLVSKVPYVGGIQGALEALSGAALSTGSSYYLEGDNVVEMHSGLDGLRYARNNTGSGASDYVGMTAYGAGITYIHYGYEYSCAAN